VAASIQPVDVAATITAFGGVAAIAVGARATRRQPEVDSHGRVALPVDPADRPAALRERIAALEAQLRDALEDVGDLKERIAMLEALRTTLEALENEQRRGTAKTRRTPAR